MILSDRILETIISEYQKVPGKILNIIIGNLYIHCNDCEKEYNFLSILSL